MIEMNRRDFIKSIGCAGLGAALGSCALAGEGQRPKKKPNILFCLADDWSWPHASIAGDKVVKTPTFDRVAREGVLFENAFVSSPSCTPSRGAMLTGQWHWRLEEGGNLWSTLQAKFDQKMAKSGVDSLARPELVFVCVDGVENEVNNGGFSQYFVNSAGDFAQDAAGAFRV